jgi:hypothetical protein
MKTNPLFHDSSVSQDSNVQTHFELMGLKTLKGERVFLRLDLNSDITFYEMNFNDEFQLFETSVWLKHRRELNYSFLVKRGEEWISSTSERQGHAMHSLVEHWIGLEGDELKNKLMKVQEGEKLQVVELSENGRESTNEEEFYDNLIKKWDL